MRSSFLLPLLLALAACGRTGLVEEEAGPPPTATPKPSPSYGPGWSIRDATPYARMGHCAVLDEGGERLIVFGGAANDTWALPLSGPHANEWAQLSVAGKHPPVHTYGGSMFVDSAVYDPAKKRMIVLLNPLPSTADETSEVEIWELSLSGTPAWHRLATKGPSPGAEVQSGRVVLDREGNRLFVTGGALDHKGVWTLSLGAEPTWSRFADMPDHPLGPFYLESSLVLDAKRQELVLLGGHPRLGRVWALSLDTKEWTLLSEGTLASSSYGVTTALDAANDRLVLFGGDENSGVSLFSLDTHEWSVADVGGSMGWYRGASSVADAKRGRILYFSGLAGEEVPNTLWAFSLDALALSEVVPATRSADFEMGERAAVWDPKRNAVVAFGHHHEGSTWLHGLGATDTWTSLAAGTTPAIAMMPGIYDTAGGAIVAFGGYHYTSQKAVVRLASSPGAEWETLAVAGGPAERARHVAVFDGANRRMVVHGGRHETNSSPYAEYGDVWALSLDGEPAWTELVPTGAAPAPRERHAAIYDPDGHRMILYGGHNEHDGAFTDLWSLSLDDEPTWTELSPSGTGPGPVLEATAVYDAEGERMILLDFGERGARVFALDLGETPAWHRFCWDGITPATWGYPGSMPNAVLVEDGLFVSVSGGAFRFDLATSYCE